MIAPIFLLLVSLAGVAATLSAPTLADYQFLAGICVLASMILLALALARGVKAAADAARPRIVVDGSNVMHWNDGVPRIESVREVVARLTSLGYTPGVVFDANAGYLLAGRYQHNRALGRQLGLPEDRIMVVPKGSPADPTVLAAARDLGARVVSNDRFRDWAAAHPEVNEPGYVIRGEFRSGQLWLDLPRAALTARVTAKPG